MNESDLKLYRKRAPQWRERYLQKRDEAFATHLNDPEKVPSERFWEVLEEMSAEAKILRSLGRHARSNMVFSMVQMLVEEGDGHNVTPTTVLLDGMHLTQDFTVRVYKIVDGGSEVEIKEQRYDFEFPTP
ncbi:MAG: hypothetical protein KDN22_31180 [Verrucomicrobiae bacterium]|nr:hypothetical protein [Verrucomicrobiae bacterium]